MKWQYLLLIGCAVLVCIVIGVVALGMHDMNRGSERSQCIFNLRAMWSSAGAIRNMNPIKIGDSMDKAVIIKNAGYEKLECPSGGTYTWMTVFPDPEKGEAPVTCSRDDHSPPSRAGW